MDTLSVDIVGHVLAVLDELIVPHVIAPPARAFADICSRLLHQVVMRERDAVSLSTSNGQEIEATEAELKRMLAVLPGSGLPDKDALADDTLIRAFATDAKELGPAAQQFERLRIKLVQLERTSLERIDPEVEFGFASIFNGGRVDRSRVKFVSPSVKPIPEMTPASLQKFLRQRGPEWQHASVKALSRIQGGFSKQTLRTHIENTPWPGDHFIIRQDRADAFTKTTVLTEYPVIQAMFAAGLSVPEPLGCFASEDLGPPFIITRLAPGANDPTGWKSDPASIQRFSAGLAKQLALLHGISPLNAGLPAGSGASVEEYIRRNIDHWSAIGKLEAPGAPRILSAVRNWLLNNIPRSTTKVAVVHGDVTQANLLTDAGNVTAVLDWEFCHLGDPQEDLNFVRLLTDDVGSWGAFLAAYVAAGGCRYVPEDAIFWKAWASFRSAAGCANALHAYRAGSYGSAAEALTLAVAALNFGPRFQLEAAEIIVARA